MATAARFALFPAGGTATPAAGQGDEGGAGPGLGDTEPGVAGVWVEGGLLDSGTGAVEMVGQKHNREQSVLPCVSFVVWKECTVLCLEMSATFTQIV